MYADTILTSTRVFDGTQEVAAPKAVAIAGDRIAAVTAPGDCAHLMGPDTETVDLGDAFVCPGIHDAHVHFFHSALYSSPLATTVLGTSEADCVAALADLAARRPAGGWLLTQGWREYRWDPPVLPSKHSLDAAYPDRPVAMYSGDAHTLWLNSCALEELGIDGSSVPPAGGSYDIGEDGQPTGIVREAAAMVLMPRIVASFSTEELEDAYRLFLQKLAHQGITGVCDVSLMAAPGLDFVRDDLFEGLLDKSELTCRVSLFPTLLDDRSRLADLQGRLHDPLLSARGFKQFFDGVSSQHTAWLHDPYSNAARTDECGRPTIDPDIMRQRVLAAASEGQPVRIHAIGDEAIHVALDIFEETRAKFGPLPQGRRNCLEHLENFQPDDMERLAQLDVVASVQPCHITLDPGGPERDLGPDRVPYMWPFSTLLGDDATLAFGTDSPVCDTDPRAGLFTATTRRDAATGQPAGGWLASERITGAQALRAYTAGSAAAAQRADDLGTLEAGKLADIAVFDRDLTTCAPDDVLEAKCLATYVGGRKVF